jgi:hypothetical protein
VTRRALAVEGIGAGFDFGGDLFLVLLDAQVGIRTVFQQRLGDLQDLGSPLRVDPVVGIADRLVQRSVTVGVHRVGIGAGVKKQIDDGACAMALAISNAVVPDFGWATFGFALALSRIFVLGASPCWAGEHQRCEAGFGGEFDVAPPLTSSSTTSA